jgi:hypothetical protein
MPDCSRLVYPNNLPLTATSTTHHSIISIRVLAYSKSPAQPIFFVAVGLTKNNSPHLTLCHTFSKNNCNNNGCQVLPESQLNSQKLYIMIQTTTEVVCNK